MQCSPQSSAGLGYAFPVENVGYWKEVYFLHTQALGRRVSRQIPKTGDISAQVKVSGPGSHFLWCNIDQQEQNVFPALLE